MEESRSVDLQRDLPKQRADPINERNGAAQTEPPEAARPKQPSAVK